MQGMWLYLARLFSKDGTESFHKVGITSHDATSRLSFGTTKVIDSDLPLKEKAQRILVRGQKYIPDNPYEHQVLHSVYYELEGDARLAERELLEQTRPFRYRPRQEFSGRSECFRNDEGLDEIILRMSTDSQRRNSEAPSLLLYRLNETGVSGPDPIARHLKVLEKCKRSRS